MPRYLFQCRECGRMFSEIRPREECSRPAFCERCGGNSQRIYTAPYLTTDPFHLRDENKFVLGRSETERTETRRADDKAYERQWDGVPVEKPKVKPMAEIAYETFGPLT